MDEPITKPRGWKPTSLMRRNSLTDRSEVNRPCSSSCNRWAASLGRSGWSLLTSRSSDHDVFQSLPGRLTMGRLRLEAGEQPAQPLIHLHLLAADADASGRVPDRAADAP